MMASDKISSDNRFKREPIVLSATVRRLERKSTKYAEETSKSIVTKNFQIEEKEALSILDLTLESEHSIVSQNHLSILNQSYLSSNSMKHKEVDEFLREKEGDETFSISDIEARTIVRVPSTENMGLKKKPFSRTSKFSQSRKSVSREGRTNLPLEETNIEDELSSLKFENNEVNLENMKLKERVNDLKEENEYLYRQMEKLNTVILGHKDTNEELSQLNEMISEKLKEYEEHVQRYKEDWKAKQTLIKTYSILEHVHWKVKADYENILKLNSSLQNQNDALLMKVNKMSKLLSANSKALPKEKNQMCTQCRTKQSKNETVIQNRNVNRMSNLSNRKDENFFELSPE